MSRWLAAVAALGTLVALYIPGHAAAAFETGILEPEYDSANPAVRDAAFDRTVEARSEVVRIHVFWRSVAASEPTSPENPLDPAYNWGTLDASVVDAAQRNLRVLFTVTGAPNWAEGEDRPAGANPGSWKPRAEAYGDFAHAVAERYSGSVLGLPDVDDFQAWNEANLKTHLSPQYEDGEQFSADHYRRMLNAFAAGVHEVDPGNRVVTTGTGPYGENPGGNRTRPLVFWRDVFCLEGRKRLVDVPCPAKSVFDIFAHHPINTSGGPHRSALHPDDASTPDFKNVVRILRKAERVNNVIGGRHPAWATEIWWESDPPDNFQGVPVKRHARWLEEALYVLWKQGARVVVNLNVRDGQFDPQNPLIRNATGLFFHDGTPKPALTAWRFPFVTHRRSSEKIRAWGKAPEGGVLTIEQKKGGEWRTLRQFTVDAGQLFNRRLRLSRGADLRARVGGMTSLSWHQSG